ncbi:MAG: hypothetical protein JKY23_06110 [Nitrospinaceae bacterium]|nr:hypothetical protein [Nitrospinaceae bacterium]
MRKANVRIAGRMFKVNVRIAETMSKANVKNGVITGAVGKEAEIAVDSLIFKN